MKRNVIAALHIISLFLFIFGFVSRAQAQTVKTEYAAFNLRDPFEKQLPGAAPVVKPPEAVSVKEKNRASGNCCGGAGGRGAGASGDYRG